MIRPKDRSADVARCRANIEAVLRYHGLPPIEIVTAQRDRVTAFAATGFHQALIRAVFKSGPRAGEQIFIPWGLVSNHGTTAIRGWREDVAMYSLQVIEHEGRVFELDIDIVNPGRLDVATLLGHGLEVAWNKLTRRKTDPFKVQRGLIERGVIA